MISLEELRRLRESDRFHHATYRNLGTLWEGLWIYAKSETGLRGFEVFGCFGTSHPEFEEAVRACKGHSVGSYGRG